MKEIDACSHGNVIYNTVHACDENNHALYDKVDMPAKIIFVQYGHYACTSLIAFVTSF